MESPNSRGLVDGFEGYQTATEADYDRALRSGLVVTDSNVLLNLYRYSSQARADLLDVLAALGTRLWIPNQVAVEFWRNREDSLADFGDATNLTISELKAAQEGAIKTVRTWVNRVSLPSDVAKTIEDSLNAGFKGAVEQVNSVARKESGTPVWNTSQDAVLARLVTLFRGKVGPPLSEDDHAAALQEAGRRIEAKEPPGFKDGNKSGVRPAGDYLLWEQSIREASDRKCPLLLVTGDVKPDWWRQEHGRTLGPRIELVQELYLRTEQRLLMARPESLLIHAARALKVSVQNTSAREIERAEQTIREESYQRVFERERHDRSARMKAAEDSMRTKWKTADLFRMHLERLGFEISRDSLRWDMLAGREDVTLAIRVASGPELKSKRDRIRALTLQIRNMVNEADFRVIPVMLSDGPLHPRDLTYLEDRSIAAVWPEGADWFGNDNAVLIGIIPPANSYASTRSAEGWADSASDVHGTGDRDVRLVRDA